MHELFLEKIKKYLCFSKKLDESSYKPNKIRVGKDSEF